MNILLIEPDWVLAETYGRAFQAEGHNVVPCASAQSGIQAADKQSPDLVVLELQLIDHSGIEFLYEFRSYSEWQHIPVIVQSHIPPAEFAANWQLLKQELGVQEYLYKPSTNLVRLLGSVNGAKATAAA
jgi:DNA-binding response OmpR family regulator